MIDFGDREKNTQSGFQKNVYPHWQSTKKKIITKSSWS